jgi:putative membrane protein
MQTNGTLRDTLALERTRLANERTFLAYVRTSLSLIAGAAVLFQFFSAVQAYLAVAWVLAVTGFLVLAVGIYRVQAVRAELRREVQREVQGDDSEA